MAISASDVKKLRDMTGAGMMDCKKALVEANGDYDEAVTILRKQGQKLSDKRADRETNEGVVIAVVSDDATRGVAINLGCETDFVAKNDSFVDFAKNIAGIALKNFPGSTEELLALEYEGGVSVGEKITEQIGVIGEKLNLGSYEKLESEMVVPYIHANYKLGVLLALNQSSEDVNKAGKDVAMQVAAMNPVAVDKDDVDASVVEKEIEIGKELARNEGKPEAILDKIAAGRLNKFYAENTLVNQKFVKDGSQTVAKYLTSVQDGLKVKAFKRVQLGS